MPHPNTGLPHIERFLQKVQKTEGGCWMWIGYVAPDGYGKFRNEHKKTTVPHRWYWEYLHGPVASDMEIDHLCKVRSCVNPAHLEVVTPKENTRRSDCGQHNAQKTHCPQGHPYDERNTRHFTFASGTHGRACRACSARRTREHRARRQA